MESKHFYIVSSPRYGSWVFTTNKKARNFLKEAREIDNKSYIWRMYPLTEEEIRSWHHPWEFDILNNVDKTIEDLKETMVQIDNFDWDKFYGEMDKKEG